MIDKLAKVISYTVTLIKPHPNRDNKEFLEHVCVTEISHNVSNGAIIFHDGFTINLNQVFYKEFREPGRIYLRMYAYEDDLENAKIEFRKEAIKLLEDMIYVHKDRLEKTEKLKSHIENGL